MRTIGSHGLGSFDQIKRGPRRYWRFRIMIRGKVHERTARTRAALWPIVHALRASVQVGGPEEADAAAEALRPPPTETMPDGRQYVRIASPAFRAWIHGRDRGICGICGTPVALAECHVDHIRPVGEGGNNDVTNLRITHARCNLRRAALRGQPVYLA